MQELSNLLEQVITEKGLTEASKVISALSQETQVREYQQKFDKSFPEEAEDEDFAFLKSCVKIDEVSCNSGPNSSFINSSVNFGGKSIVEFEARIHHYHEWQYTFWWDGPHPFSPREPLSSEILLDLLSELSLFEFPASKVMKILCWNPEWNSNIDEESWFPELFDAVLARPKSTQKSARSVASDEPPRKKQKNN